VGALPVAARLTALVAVAVPLAAGTGDLVAAVTFESAVPSGAGDRWRSLVVVSLSPHAGALVDDEAFNFVPIGRLKADVGPADERGGDNRTGFVGAEPDCCGVAVAEDVDAAGWVSFVEETAAKVSNSTGRLLGVACTLVMSFARLQ